MNLSIPINVSQLSVVCVHDVKVTKYTKHVGQGRTSGLNDVLVFEPTSIVTGSIPTQYIYCQSAACSIKCLRYVNLDDALNVSNI